MISQFAVGGGLYLPLAERKALREGRETDWLKELVRHSKFFLVLTGVFGTVSRRGHLVCHRTDAPGGHQHVDSQLRLRLGHRVGLLHGRADHGRRLLLHLEQDRREAAPDGGLGVRGRVGLHAGHHQRHSDLHADAGRHVAWRGRHRARGEQVLERVLQSHLLAEPAAALAACAPRWPASGR